MLRRMAGVRRALGRRRRIVLRGLELRGRRGIMLLLLASCRALALAQTEQWKL